MTDTPVTLSGSECNGDRPPENGQQPSSQTRKTADADETQTYYGVEPSLQDLPAKETQEESGNTKGNVLPRGSKDQKIENTEENLFVVHQAIQDLSLQESAEDTVFQEGHPWKKIPLNSHNLDMSRQKERIVQHLEQREDESAAHQATEIEWLGFQKSSQVDILHSKCDEEEEVWNEEINEEDVDECAEDEDEDEVRVIEFKRKYREGSPLKEESLAREDSPLSSPSSQPGTPDEQLVLGKKGDIARNSYSRYNTISYRKIRKGNTKQRIDEFESMMHL